jgi:hypothetical protein
MRACPARLALAGVAAAACAACSPHPAAAPARPPAARSAEPPARAAAGLAVPLPVTPAWLRAAAALAARFAAADDTWSAGQSPAAWLAGLRPMTAPQLQAALAQSAATPGLLAQRAGTGQSATVTGEQARDLAPGTVTFTIQLALVTTSTTGTATGADDLAVTVTATTSRPVVWDAEPAAAGNTGGDPDGSTIP